MNETEILSTAVLEAPVRERGLFDALRRFKQKLDTEGMLPVRYGLTAGVIGVPGSIVQLWAMLYAYEYVVGDYGPIALNAFWLLNFELGLLRNFGLHSVYTWRMKPTWSRLGHAHVAALGALVIDLAAFNIVVYTTGYVLLAQIFGAGSGFGFNFGYNKLKTFAVRRQRVAIEQV